MDPVITAHRQEIADLCRRYRVQQLELFGSAASARFDPAHSDVDFLVEFEPLADGEHADAYFGLLESLKSLLGRPVDLVMTRAIRNRSFLESIEPTRTLVYAAWGQEVLGRRSPSGQTNRSIHRRQIIRRLRRYSFACLL